MKKNTVRIKFDKYAVAEDLKFGKSHRKIDVRRDRRMVRLALDGFCK